MMRRGSARRAFTLLEVMISLVIYSTLMGVIAHAIHTTKNLDRYATKRSQAGEGMDEDVLETYLTRKAMAEDFLNFVRPPFNRPDAASGDASAFALDGSSGMGEGGGNKDRIGYWAAVQRPFAFRGIHWIEWQIDGATKQLARTAEDRLGVYGKKIPSLHYLSGLNSLTFRFSHSPEDGTAVRNWKRASLPRYIHVSLGFQDASKAELSWVFPIGQGE